MRAIVLGFFLAASLVCACNAQSERLIAPAGNFGLSSGPWIWRQDFQASASFGPSQDFQYSSPPATVARFPANVPGTYGVISRAPDGSPYYAVNHGPDGSVYNLFFQTNANNVNNGDFVLYQQPYIGPITQSITMYIPATGAYAWTPPVASGFIAWELDMSPDTGNDYSLETCIDAYITSPGTITIGFSYGGDAGSTGGWPNSYVTPFATITSNDWYTITNTSYRAGNLTTDPAFTLMAVYNSKRQLVGALARPQSVTLPTNLTNMAGPGTNLHQTDQWLIAYLQSGLLPSGNNLLIGNFGYYGGFPNQGLRPVLTNGYSASGATAGSAYSGFTAHAPGATSFSAQFQSGISSLSINSSTGAITGTPSTAGTYYFMVVATNQWGADAQLYQLVVSASSVASAILLGIP
jgi:hypothetical protein